MSDDLMQKIWGVAVVFVVAAIIYGKLNQRENK